MATLAEVVAMLDVPTAEDVADLLRAHGVKGRGADSCCCPVAMFVRCLLERKVTVSGGTVCGFPGWPGVGHPVPPAARDFIQRFDAADPAFADLVAS